MAQFIGGKKSPDLLILAEVLIDVNKLMFAASDAETVAIPTGIFIMGCSNDDEDCYSDESPRHKVKITRSYEMMRSEVTQSLYQVVTGKNPSQFNECGTDCPVENLSWLEATRFANELSDIFGLEPCYFIYKNEVIWKNKACEGWRLPTEAEWEYAARGGQGDKYPSNNFLTEIAWFSENSNGQTHAVCQKEKNPFKLCDMAGNVAEWVWDPYDENIYTAYQKIGTVRDPIGTASQNSKPSLRGGSWEDEPKDIRVSARETYLPIRKSGNYGVRLVRNR